MSETKKIRCSRCRRLRIVPFNWEFKECRTCHDRTVRRRPKNAVKLEKIEKTAITQLVNFESAYQNYRKFCRNLKVVPKPKAEFQKEWLMHNKEKIEGIRKIIEKYNDSRCRILSYACLEFRRLFSTRLNYFNTELFCESLTKQEFELFYNHVPKCRNCNLYTILHKYDMPTETDKEEFSQGEFDNALDQFFEATKTHSDSIEQWEKAQGLRDFEES